MMVDNSPFEAIAQVTPAPPLSRSKKIAQAFERIAQKHECSAELILSGNRAAFVVKARRELAYDLRTQYNWPLESIAKIMQRADHTSVRHLIVNHCINYGLPLPLGMTSGTRSQMKRKRRPKTNRK